MSFLMLLAISSDGSKRNNTDISCVRKSTGIDNHCSNDSTCPTWFTCSAKKRCECDKSHTDKIVCDNEAQISAVLNCNCVTYDKESRSTYAGACFYNCQDKNPSTDLPVRELPKNPETLVNNSACTYFHRTGLLCGDCEKGYSPLVLSYNFSCVECPDGHKNWWKFILAGFVPLTIFYFFILAFNINVTSSRLRGVIWYSQAMSMPVFIRIILLSCSIKHAEHLKTIKVAFAFYSLWNLDMLLSVIPNICLNVTTLQALSLEYLIALYPFVLILLSYFLIVLYDRRVVFIVTAWKPFKKIFATFRKSWDIRTSVLDSFATFFLLSYMKVSSVTCDVLTPTKIYQLGSNKSIFGLYYSPSVAYFGDQHFPYAVLAIIILTLLVLIPTIIFILYPCHFFQNFLSLIPINWHFLHAFVDSFQGCYKDGTEPGTLDCRWFSVIMLLIRPLLLIIYSFTRSTMYFVYSLVALLILLIAVINIQPFKNIASHCHQFDTIFIFLLCFSHITLLGRGLTTIEKHFTYLKVITIITFLTGVLPLFYISFLIGSWLFSKINMCIPQLIFRYLFNRALNMARQLNIKAAT